MIEDIPELLVPSVTISCHLKRFLLVCVTTRGLVVVVVGPRLVIILGVIVYYCSFFLTSSPFPPPLSPLRNIKISFRHIIHPRSH